MNGGLSMTDRWLVLAVLALAAAFVLTVLAWLAVGREMLELMTQVQATERLLHALPDRSPIGIRSAETEPVSRAGSPGRVNLRGGSIEMEVLVTAYSPEDPGVGNITRSGIPVDRGVVAVDPQVIPVGSVVHVPGYGYAVAADTGGLIRGRRIDVYLPSHGEAIKWGVKRLKITVYTAKEGAT